MPFGLQVPIELSVSGGLEASPVSPPQLMPLGEANLIPTRRGGQRKTEGLRRQINSELELGQKRSALSRSRPAPVRAMQRDHRQNRGGGCQNNGAEAADG